MLLKIDGDRCLTGNIRYGGVEMKNEVEIVLKSIRETLSKDSRPTQIAVLLYCLLVESGINDESIVQVAVTLSNLVN